MNNASWFTYIRGKSYILQALLQLPELLFVSCINQTLHVHPVLCKIPEGSQTKHLVSQLLLLGLFITIINNGFHTSHTCFEMAFHQEFYRNWYWLISQYFYALRWWGIYKNKYVLRCSWINKYTTYLCFEIFLNQLLVIHYMPVFWDVMQVIEVSFLWWNPRKHPVKDVKV